MKIPEFKIPNFLRDKQPDVSVGAIETALEEAKAVRAQADNQYKSAESEYRDNLLNPDSSAAVRSRGKMGDAELDRQRADALIAALNERLNEARTRENENDRQKAYSLAKSMRDRAAKRLREEYESLATKIAEILEEVERADVAVYTVNATLPQKAERLLPTEVEARKHLHGEEKIISDEIVHRWVFSVTGKMIADKDFERVTADGRGKHYLPGPDSRINGVVYRGKPNAVEQRRFRKKTLLPATASKMLPQLASGVNLPGLLTKSAIFEPTKVYNGEVLETVSAIRERLAKARKSEEALQPPKTTYEPIAETSNAEHRNAM